MATLKFRDPLTGEWKPLVGGSLWWSGVGAPVVANGILTNPGLVPSPAPRKPADGDFYLERITGDLYVMQGVAFSLQEAPPQEPEPQEPERVFVPSAASHSFVGLVSMVPGALPSEIPPSTLEVDSAYQPDPGYSGVISMI